MCGTHKTLITVALVMSTQKQSLKLGCNSVRGQLQLQWQDQGKVELQCCSYGLISIRSSTWRTVNYSQPVRGTYFRVLLFLLLVYTVGFDSSHYELCTSQNRYFTDKLFLPYPKHTSWHIFCWVSLHFSLILFPFSFSFEADLVMCCSIHATCHIPLAGACGSRPITTYSHCTLQQVIKSYHD